MDGTDHPTSLQPFHHHVINYKYSPILPKSASNHSSTTESDPCFTLRFDPAMSRGTLEVLLVSAKGLEDSDFLSNIDPYAVLTYRSQEKKSSVASGGGSSPEWNETFLFSISEGVTELRIKLMDKDTFTADDSIGEVTIPLEPVFEQENIPPSSYSVVKDENYCGEIKVGLKFVCERSRDTGSEEEFGGWKESSME